MLFKYPAVCVAVFVALLSFSSAAGRSLKQETDPTLIKGRPPTFIDGVGWSSSGLFAVYQAGVMHALLRANVLRWGGNPGVNYAGSGDGAIVAAAALGGQNPQAILRALETSIQFAVNEEAACVRAGRKNCDPLKERYEEYVQRVLKSLMRHNTASASNNTLTTHLSLVPNVTVSKPPPPACTNVTKGAEKQAINQYSSRNDLEAALLATSYYPGMSAPNCTRTFRGRQYVNAQLTNPMPCPINSQACLRVSAVPPAVAEKLGWGRLSINGTSPDIFPGLSGTPLPFPEERWADVMFDAEEVASRMNEIFSLGFTDGRTWARLNFYVVS